MNEWDRAYMRKPVAHVAPEPEPVAWQWLNTGHMRKKIPKNATNPAHWNPLYAAPPAAPAPAVPLTDADIDRIADAVPVDQIGVHITTWHRRFARAVLSATPAVPLTDERIDEVASAMFYADEPADSMVMAFRSQWMESIARPLARAIERAHGIGGGGNG